jgi:transcriptional regulator with XRE-family HTH domain
VLQRKLGKRIADLRRAKKLTQEQLAEALGCSVEFISLVERGVNAPSVAGLEKFARILKVEISELFIFPEKKG